MQKNLVLVVRGGFCFNLWVFGLVTSNG